ncbi:MAG: serine hydrolase domain-containing protein [Bacteroidota bacterium]
MKKLTPILILLLFVACTPKAEDNSKLLEERIARIENGLQHNLQIRGLGGDSIPTYNIEERLKELGIPGVSVAVVHEGKLEWAKGYGMADSSENRPVTDKTMFLAGSISKPVAALRAHQLAEEGLISIDANVNDYLTSWKVPDNEFSTNEKVTIRRILNHTAGLTVWGFPGYDKGDTIPSVVEVLDGKGNTDSVRVYKEPGESWMYSGGGYTVMQLMITDLENTSYPELMQEHVLDPLGMTASTFANPLPQAYHAIAATGYRSNGNEVEGKWPIYPEMAAAGLWTTPSQLIRYAQEIQKISQNKEDGLLKVATVDEMLTPGMNDHGLGPVVNEHTFGHGGADEGFRANLIAWKNQPTAVVIMVNSDNGSIMQEILLSIAKEYDLDGVEPMIRTVHPTSIEARKPMEGTYDFPEFGKAIVTIKDKGFEVGGEFAADPITLLPENDSLYFNQNSGTYYTFLFEEGKVTGLRFWDNYGKKVK